MKTTTNPLHVHAARILRQKHASYRLRPFAELLLVVAGTAVMNPDANAFQLARDTYRSENGDEIRKSRRIELSGIVNSTGRSIDCADSHNEIQAIEDAETQAALVSEIRGELGEIADGILAGLNYREIAEICGTNITAISRKISKIKGELCGEFE